MVVLSVSLWAKSEDDSARALRRSRRRPRATRDAVERLEPTERRDERKLRRDVACNRLAVYSTRWIPLTWVRPLVPFRVSFVGRPEDEVWLA